ncbi:1717_t:CDS:2 [Ambispora leptoticha]|uniref:1717_t:CDS:1 n=1 Tax=Ambispora leptoticha TaxID=144679 RepID=A0A9N9I0D8_9GLOM|nr:1717_t:CDS:2 [Ambispora leptoticha]
MPQRYSTTCRQQRSGQNAFFEAIEILQEENARLLREVRMLRRQVGSLGGEVTRLEGEVANLQFHMAENLRENQQRNRIYACLVYKRNLLRAKVENL